MSSARHIGAALRRAGTLAGLAMLAGCSALTGSGIPVTESAGQRAPVVASAGLSEDEAIGLREHPRIVASYGGVYSDRQAEVMLARIAGRLLAAADQPNTSFTVTILDTPDVNAFALPGGYIYVTRGILALASDTSELAAVLAHEIAHVTLKHARARTNRIRTTEVVDRVVSGVFGGNAATDQAANRSRLSLAAFNQSQELAADKEGIVIAGKAGYDPHAAARFLGAMGRFARFSAGDAAQTDDFLSSHPSTPDRVQKAVESARAAFGAPGLGEVDRASYMNGIEGLAFGDSPANGAIVGRRFVNPAARFTFSVPEGYTLQNSKGAVVGVAGDGEAVRFDSPEVPVTMSLADYLRSGWIAGLRPETVRSGRSEGVETASGVAVTEQWSFRVAVARLEGRVYRFIFAAKADSEAFARGADMTLRSFRAATAQDIGSIRQMVVRTVIAAPGDTSASLARRMAGLGRGEELFYVLNNLYPGDPIEPGQKYKVVAIR